MTCAIVGPSDLEEHRARIHRAIAASEEFADEQRKLTAEAIKLSRDTMLAPWQLAFAGFGAGAAFVAALVSLASSMQP